MQQDQTERPRATHYADPIDQAAAETDAQIDYALDKQRQIAEAAKRRWAPRADGDCACGCGNEVDPRRLAAGYGLAIECAERMERK